METRYRINAERPRLSIIIILSTQTVLVFGSSNVELANVQSVLCAALELMINRLALLWFVSEKQETPQSR